MLAAVADLDFLFHTITQQAAVEFDGDARLEQAAVIVNATSPW